MAQGFKDLKYGKIKGGMGGFLHWEGGGVEGGFRRFSPFV